ncbi:sulfotransferase [Euryhalocaulis caribicus]|uniref:sulfotransferase n=1 Tax=Euryhalocaulis caribicus TaxID=1161401 RepID=UPI0003A4ABC1|nr:sulfotransferase [Euryhalocaulis caribicus]
MILITGAARSGTSLTTQILKAHGCWLGSAVNSLYENTDIREQVLKPYLRAVDADPLGQDPLPDTGDLPPHHGLCRAIAERMEGGPGRWAYKDAKLALVWPAWAKMFPEAKWVIVRRKTEEIVESCIKASFMRAHGEDRAAWARWVEEHERRFEAMMTAGLDAIEVWPRKFIDDPEAFRPVAEHCGLEFNASAVCGAINPDRYHK